MDQLISFIENISAIQVIDVVIAIGIIIFFRIFSSWLSYIIIRLFKITEKRPKRIKDSAFYSPLKIFFIILGFYIAILYLKVPLKLTDKFMQITTKIFRMISIIVFAKGLAKSFTVGSTLVKIICDRIDKQADDSMFQFGLKMIRALIYIIAGFLVITELGFNLSGLVAGLGISGVIVTLAAQDTAKNLFGGLMIFLDKPFVVGDWIQVDTFEGTVEDITFRSTRVRMRDNSLAQVPNSVISSTTVVNISRIKKRLYEIDLQVNFDTSLAKLSNFEHSVLDFLNNYDMVVEQSANVFLKQINSDDYNIHIYCYLNVTDFDQFCIEKGKLNYEIMNIIKQNDIKLALETMEIKNT